MKSSNLYFTTGEFSKLLDVKKHTLFHYNEIGLLTPQYESENGYRYYFLWQINEFCVIRILQKLGMSLKEIKQYMNKQSPEEFSQVISQKEDQIDKEIQHLKEMKKFLRRQKEKILEYQNCVLNTPHLVSLKENALLMTPIPDSNPPKIANSVWHHMQQREEKHLSDGTICATYRMKDFQNGRFDYHNTVYTELDNDNPEYLEGCHIFPAGQYLQVYCQSEDNVTRHSYEYLHQYAQKNGLCLGNIFYEDILLDEMTYVYYQSYITKMVVAVKSSEAPSYS